MRLRERTQAELEDLERQVRVLEDRRGYLEAQLAVIKERAPLGSDATLEPESRLKLLRNQYVSLAAVYAESHPDLARMRREIEALEKSTGAAPEPDARVLDRERNSLAQLQERYEPAHPDVARQKARVAALEQGLAGAAAQHKADNPAWLALASQLDGVKREAESLRKRRGELEQRLADYQKRLEQTPSVEQAYRDLVRDHEGASLKYKEIRAKEMEARVALELENERKGERFSLIDPPQYPERPQEPNRRKLLFLAFMASVGGGVGAAALAESMSHTVRGARALGALLEAPLLGVLPRVSNEAERARRRRLLWAALAVLAALGLAALAAVHVLVMPLESLWYVLLRRLQP